MRSVPGPESVTTRAYRVAVLSSAGVGSTGILPRRLTRCQPALGRPLKNVRHAEELDIEPVSGEVSPSAPPFLVERLEYRRCTALGSGDSQEFLIVDIEVP